MLGLKHLCTLYSWMRTLESEKSCHNSGLPASNEINWMHLVLMPPDPSGFASSHISYLWNDIVGEEGYSDFHKKNDQTSIA